MGSLSSLLLSGFAAVALAAPVTAQRTDDQIQPKSVELMHQGQTLMATGKLEDAENALETALAVDPRNRWAYVDIARVAEKQHLFGKAVLMTDKALVIEPNDPDAIAVQGEAMVEMGATGPGTAESSEAAADLRVQGMPSAQSAFGRNHPRPDGGLSQGAGNSEEGLIF